MARKKRIPLRKCIVTKEMVPKNDLIRIVRTKEGEVFVDPTGKQNGRGAYLSKSIEVVEKARKNKVLDREFKVEIADSIYDEIIEIIEG